MSIPSELIYPSVREEILEQKKCQFQLVAAAITITVAVLAFATKDGVGPAIYVAPILMNMLSMMIVLNKSMSIQRMVGYLQLMESDKSNRRWMWEYHLNIYREQSAIPQGPEPSRKHTYVLSVSTMLISVSVLCAALYFWGPSGMKIRQSPSSESTPFYWAMATVVVGLLVTSVACAAKAWLQLVLWSYTSTAIRTRWEDVITKHP